MIITILLLVHLETLRERAGNKSAAETESEAHRSGSAGFLRDRSDRKR